MTAFSFPLRGTAALLLASSLVLSGCASKYGPQVTQVNYYPQCYQPISELRADENTTTKSTAGGAVAGALIGALIGGLATGKAEGALVGAAAGGATGAVAGHAYGKSQERKRNQEFYQQYMHQLDGETAQMDRASAAARVAAKCYNTQFKEAVADARSGRISKIELSNRYDEIRSGLEETSRILNVTYNNMADKDAQYRQVMEEETGTSQPVQTASQPRKKPRAQTARASQGATPEARQVAQSTTKWQKSRDGLEDTRRDVQEQLESNKRTMEALEG